jgi:hypothetical protein
MSVRRDEKSKRSRSKKTIASFYKGSVEIGPDIDPFFLESSMYTALHRSPVKTEPKVKTGQNGK